jgi:hypothetical protein
MFFLKLGKTFTQKKTSRIAKTTADQTMSATAGISGLADAEVGINSS